VGSIQQCIPSEKTKGYHRIFFKTKNLKFVFTVAREFCEMMNYFEEYSHFGPDAEKQVASANKLCPEGFKKLAEWASQNMKPQGQAM
jgi:hypothetical protein